MKEKIIGGIIATVIALSCIGIIVFATPIVTSDETLDPVATISEDYIPSETASIEEVIILNNVSVERVEPTTYDEANILLEDAIFRRSAALAVYENLLVLGYADDHPAVEMAKRDVQSSIENCTYYEEDAARLLEQSKWEVRAQECPTATYIWLYMKNNFGWSDETCAGIMGNMMAEVGGGQISGIENWEYYSKNSPYGVIQWLGSRKKDLFAKYGKHPTIEEQLIYMYDELYGTNGVKQQVSSKNLDRIINATSPEDCAYVFACHFERCGEGNRSIRKNYARKAYNYFTS